MKRLIAIIFAALCASSHAQTGITVMADTNRVIRTNFSLLRSQVSDLSGASFAISNITGLQTALDGKLATNGSAAGLTNFPASVLLTNSSESVFPAALLRTNSSLSSFPQGLLRTNGDGSGLTNLPNANLSNAIGVLPVSNGGSGATNAGAARTNFALVWEGLTNSDAAGFRTALSLGTAATNAANAFQPASSALTNLAANNGGALTNVLPAYSNNVGKVLSVAAGATNVEWVVVSNALTDASTLTNFPASILQTNSTTESFPSFLLRTNGDGSSLTNIAVSVNLSATNVTGILPQNKGGTGISNTSILRQLLIANSNNTVVWASKDAALQQLEIYVDNGASTNTSLQLGLGSQVDTISSTNNNSIALGRTATVSGGSEGSIAIGRLASVSGSVRSVAIGASTSITSTNVGGNYNVAIGNEAAVREAGYAVQLSDGTNSNSYTIQFLQAGSVNTNQWAALAGSTLFGRYIMAAPTNGTSGQILALNNSATAVVWTNIAGTGVVNLADTTNGVTNTLGIANGGTGATTANGALTNLGIFTASAVVIGGTNSVGANVILGADSVGRGGSGLGGVAIGRNANNTNSGIAIGYAAYADGKGVGGTAIGYQATNISDGGAAIGYQATATNGFAGGRQAKALGADNVQLGTGSNTNNNTIQFLSAGSVDTNEWSRIAALSSYPTTNIQITVVGGTTNTLVFSNGILTSVTTP